MIELIILVAILLVLSGSVAVPDAATILNVVLVVLLILLAYRAYLYLKSRP